MRIGVFVCHCGTNIAGTVDCEAVARAALTLPDVVYSTDETYTCSEPGQKAIREAVVEHKLDGVVVASCSPRMHETTFRRTVERAGLNPFMMEMANIREQVAWIGKNKATNTRKAIDMVRAAAAKLRKNRPLTSKSFKVNKRVLVVGGGVAGIQAALDCADAGLEVLLAERTSSIGGRMAQLDKTFPTVDCSTCVLGPKMVDASQHPSISILPCTEVEDVKGYVGNFTVRLRRKATYVDFAKCTGCGLCSSKCPSNKAEDHFNEGLGTTTAISIPFPQAIPKKATIDPAHCLKLTTGKCGVCAKVCPTGAVNYEMEDSFLTKDVGAVIVATGYGLFDPAVLEEFGGGRYPDVVTSIQYERMLSASGPTGGHLKRPSNGEEPKSVVFVSCVGSRDPSLGRPYCSNFCCMYTAKQSILTKTHIPDSQSTVFYIDIRAPQKGYEEFVRRAQEEFGTRYVRGRVAKIYPRNGRLVVQGADTLLGAQVEIEADLVVLAVGVEPSPGADELAAKLRVSTDENGFFMESHPKLRPVETNTAGVFLAGACQGAKDIPSSVGQGSAAAAKAIALLSHTRLMSDPQVAHVDPKRCVACFKCREICPFGAIEEKEIRGRIVAEVVEAVCQGCGTCSVACPQSAIQLEHFKDDQILAEVDTLCRTWAIERSVS